MTTATQPTPAKRLRLEDIVKNGEPVYVRNRTKPKGPIILRIADPTSGKSYPLTIPRTFIPIDVTAQIPGDILVRSIDFKQIINGGSVVLISREEAETELDTHTATVEYKRLFTTQFSDLQNTSTKIYDTIQKIEEGKTAASLNKFNESEEATVSPAVQGICTRYNSKELSVEFTINEFRCIEEDITIQDCDYIVANCQDDVRKWALEKRDSLRAAEVASQQ